MDPLIKITINGENRTLNVKKTVYDLVNEICGPDAQGVAVAKNGAIIRKSEWKLTLIEGGDKLEVLQATSGG